MKRRVAALLAALALLIAAAPTPAFAAAPTVRNLASSTAGLSGYGQSGCRTSRGYDFAGPGEYLSVGNFVRPQRAATIKKKRLGVTVKTWHAAAGDCIALDLDNGDAVTAQVG